jgi:uncharacterized protein
MNPREASNKRPMGIGSLQQGRRSMARYEVLSVDEGAFGGANVSADVFYDLGLKFATGADHPADLVEAHKWFNIAASRGNKDAIRLRRELATEMSEAEIADAQRAARDWLTRH